MKNKVNIIYVSLCMIICLIPFVGMTVAKTDTTTENRRMAEFPKLSEEGKWNVNYLEGLGEWFEDHFAFRPQMVMTDSVIQSKVFKVSNMDTVLVGTDGWLYYTSTLPDYLGNNVFSDQKAYNAAHNIELTQHCVEAYGGTFLLAIAPNKNTLYPDNMPYYYNNIVSDTGNIDKLVPEIYEKNIPYADLFAAFNKENETLYLKRDSHWNGKGAVLAYNTIMDALVLDHETYETVPVVRSKDEYGDLNTMIYPIHFEPEWNYNYEGTDGYTYVTDTESVEDAFIETHNDEGTGSLLMFRDSFGNTLLPLMASAFENAYFSKAVPYNLGEYINQYHPEYVIVEKVERNIADFAENPPLISGLEVEGVRDASDGSDEQSENDNKENSKDNSGQKLNAVDIGECEYNTNYWQFSGASDEIKSGSRVYIEFSTDAGDVNTYEAYTITDSKGDSGYLLYMDKAQLFNGKMNVSVLVDNNGEVAEIADSQWDSTIPIE